MMHLDLLKEQKIEFPKTLNKTDAMHLMNLKLKMLNLNQL